MPSNRLGPQDGLLELVHPDLLDHRPQAFVRAGVGQVRRDLKEASPPNEVSRSPDPNDPNTTLNAQKAGDRDRFLWNALLVARVLAELGDYSGYELAARAAFESQQAAVDRLPQ